MKILRDDVENIHKNVLRILAEVGFECCNESLLSALGAAGAEVDSRKSLARFPAAVVEEFLEGAPKEDWATRKGVLDVQAPIYDGRYEDPSTGELRPMTEERLAEYAMLAHALPNVDSPALLGCGWKDPEKEALFERFYSWKYGLRSYGSLHPASCGPQLKDLLEAYAGLKAKALGEVFTGAVYMKHSLRLDEKEAGQYAYWWKQGCEPEVTYMTTGGLNAPVTPAGMVTMNLACQLALGLLRKACFGKNDFRIKAMISACDMRSLTRPYGRPEMPVVNRLVIAMAEHYGVGCFVQSGYADAKRPSFEAGAQKAIGTSSALQLGADTMLAAGALSIDEVFSPIQLILDNELAGALRHLSSSIDCSDDAIGINEILELGTAPTYIAQPHTVMHFRKCLWEPELWSRSLLARWEGEGMKMDVDLARRRYLDLTAINEADVFLSDEEERDLLAVF